MSGVDRSIGRDMRSVEGWLNILTAQVIAALGQFQTANGLSGAVGEIGVHHGKLWLVLDHVATPDETRFVVDLFGQQELNTDSSGLGDQARFELNRARLGANRGRLEVISASSLDITPPQLIERVGPVRLFSVDGGHTAQCTHNDLRLADGVLTEDGVVALDDVFHEHWPGVVTGLAQHLLSGNNRLVPFCIVPGKVLLSRPEIADYYMSFVCDSCSADLFKTHDFFGKQVPILMRRATFARRMKSPLEGTPLLPLARWFYYRFMQ